MKIIGVSLYCLLFIRIKKVSFSKNKKNSFYFIKYQQIIRNILFVVFTIHFYRQKNPYIFLRISVGFIV